jgi:hypothetical protein
VRRAAIASAIACAALTACSTEETLHTPDPHLNRMLQQPRRNAYTEDSFFANGMTMQHPPSGTIARDELVEIPIVMTGVDQGRYVESLPMRVDRPMIERGRARFDTYCAACHGVRGNGTSIVAEKMELKRPPSLIIPPIADYPPGQVFERITDGYGLMPSYSAQLSVDDRWAVVAYVRALELSQHARVAELPDTIRDELAKEAP